jgi:hypothetical protein
MFRDTEAGRMREAINKQTPCAVCLKRNRLASGLLCSQCAQRDSEHGHPLSKAVPLREMTEELTASGRLVTANLHHPAIDGFKEFFKAWVLAAKLNPHGTPGGQYVARFEGTDAEAEKVLTMAVAVYLRFHVYHDFRIRDTRSLWFAISNRCILYAFQMTAKERSLVSRPARRAVALHLQRNLGELLAAFLTAFHSREAAQAEQKRLLDEQPLAF